MDNNFLTIPLRLRGNRNSLPLVISAVQLVFDVQCYYTIKPDSFHTLLSKQGLSSFDNESLETDDPFSLSSRSRARARSNSRPNDDENSKELNVPTQKKECSDLTVSNSQVLGQVKYNLNDGCSHETEQSFKTTCKEKEIIVLLFQTKSSQENLEKAKSFARLHLIQEEDYITSTQQVRSQEELAMVKQCSQDLQASTLTLITFNPQKCEIRFQGPQLNVNEARSRVNEILGTVLSERDYESQKCETEMNKALDLSTVCFNLEQISTYLPGNGQSSFSAAECLDPFTVEKQYEHSTFFSSKISNESDLPSDEGPQSRNNNKELRRDSSDSSFSSSSYSDEERKEDNVLTNPTYNQRVEDALKLGYSENVVKLALTKLGPNCDKNDLLSELIKIGSTTLPEAPSTEGSAPTYNSRLEQEFISSQSLRSSVQWQSSSNFPLAQTDTTDLALEFEDSATIRDGPTDLNDSSNLRHVIIDGSNVAMSHGKNVFSCRGIQIAVDWFRQRGHKEITVFVPQWRKETSRPDAPIIDQEILTQLETEKILSFTPARRVKGQRVVCYDDRFILNLAVETDGIVVSNDVYRDLYHLKDEYRKVIDDRLLMYTFAQDRFMPPEDPYGRSGPSLDNLLRKKPSEPSPRPPDCPYGKKCTYGNKCRFYHPERGFTPHKSVTETLKEQADLKLQERASKMSELSERGRRPKQRLTRTRSLVPGEPLPPRAWEVGQEKPRLTHSKSLVMTAASSKSPEYLDESRKKLEEAERALLQESFSASQQASSSISVSSSKYRKKCSVGEDMLQCSSVNVSKSKDRKKYSQGEEILQSFTSSVPDMEPAFTATSNMPSAMTSPTRILGQRSPRASPSHLTVPKTQEHGGYISGHLLLAKNLSDEFSDHPSSPSSTRTSSPVMPPMKMADLRTGKKSEHSSRESLLDEVPSPSRLQMIERTQTDPNSMSNLDVIQSVLSMEYGMANTRKMSSSQDLLDSSMYPSTDSSHNLSPLDSLSFGHLRRESAPVQHSENNFSGNALQGASASFLGGIKSYPWSSQEASRYFQQQDHHENLRRSFSSSGNVHRLSEAPLQIAPHLALRPQQSVPLQQKQQPQRRQSHPFQMSRQNSTSDPQLHQMAQLSEISDHPIGMSVHQQPNHKPQIMQQQQFRQQQQHQQFHQFQIEPLVSESLSSPWPDAPSHMFSPNLPPSPYQMMSHTGLDTGPFQQSGPQQGLPLRGSVTSSFHQQTPPLQGHPSQVPSWFNPHMAPPPPHGQYAYFNSNPNLANQPGYPMNNSSSIRYPPRKSSTASRISHGMLPEDEPISPNDPRSVTFYHLSGLFGNVVVTKVMNRNPTVTDPGQLCNLISQFKQNTGL